MILLNSLTAEIIVANTVSVIEFCNRSLVEAHSKLRVKSFYKVWNSMLIFTSSVTSTAELKMIKQ